MTQTASRCGPLAVIAALLAVGPGLTLTGCGSSTPTNHSYLATAAVEPEMAALVEAWADAQRTGDETALAGLVAPNYHYNGVTAEHLHDLLLAPHTDHTHVTGLRYEILENTTEDEHIHAAQEHVHAVLVRVRMSGHVGGEIIHQLASQEQAEEHHEHEHVHSHAAVSAAHTENDHALVPFRGTCDVVLKVGHEGSSLSIVAQRIQVASFRFGGGMEAAVLAHVHAHPEHCHPGHEVEVHGRVALLPPGGIVRARMGEGDPAAAQVTRGAFAVHLTAPQEEGFWLARVEALGGNIQAQTASLTIAEREVHVVHDHDS